MDFQHFLLQVLRHVSFVRTLSLIRMFIGKSLMNDHRYGAKLPSVAYESEAKPQTGGCCPGHGPAGHGHGDVVGL